MDVFKNFLFPKIDFKRDIIRAKIWFLYGKRLLANNMTGHADVRLCKLGGGWWLVKWMDQALFFSLSRQRSKKKKLTPDLRLTKTKMRAPHEYLRGEAKLTPYVCLLLVKSVLKLNQNLHSLPINSLGQETKEILNQIGWVLTPLGNRCCLQYTSLTGALEYQYLALCP